MEQAQFELERLLDESDDIFPNSSDCVSDDGCLEGLMESDGQDICSLCSHRLTLSVVLNCLHCFDQVCLEREQRRISSELEGPYPMIACPICSEPTILLSGSVASLPHDWLFVHSEEANRLPAATQRNCFGTIDVNSSGESIRCGGCTTGKEAVAKCRECADFLCEQCCAMHSVMKLFSKHCVEELTPEDRIDSLNLSKRLSLNKPIYCSEHEKEMLKYFCQDCQTVVCSECLTAKHRQHPCERLSDIGQKLRNDLQAKHDKCEALKHNMENDVELLQERLQDINDAMENNRSLIDEVFNSLRSFIEEIKENLLKQNKNLHSLLEMKVLENVENGQRTINQIDHALSFASKYLHNGSAAQLAVVYATAAQWIAMLSRRSICTQVSTAVPFYSADFKSMKMNAERAFGYFGEPPPTPPTLTSSSTAPLSTFDTSQHVSGVQEHQLRHFRSLQTVDDSDTHSLSSPVLSLSPSDTVAAIHSAADAIMSAGLGHNLFSGLTQANVSPPACQTSPTASDSGLSDHSVVISSGNGSNVAAAASSYFNRNMQQLTYSLDSGGNGVASGLSRALVSGCASMLPSSMSMDRSSLSLSLSPRSTTPSLDSIPASGSAFGFEMGSGNGLASDSGHSSGALSPTLLASLASCGGSTSSSSTNQPLAKPGTTAGFNPNPNPPFSNRSGRCMQMTVRHRWGSLGSNRGQFNSPHGFCLGFDEEIVVADTQNHRIQVFDKTGEFKYMFGVAGREEGQLWYPRKVAVMRSSGRFVVCDRGNERSRMQIFNKNGHFAKKIAIRYIDIVAGLAINSLGQIVAVDSVSPTVFVINENGDLVKWFDCSDYMREPSDISINGREYFICDFKGHCVAVFQDDGTFLRRVGTEAITNFPNGIDVSDHGDVLVGDSHGNKFHVAVFTREGNLISEFECPSVKVSRCCGLKITSEGLLVTLAKNNHHVLVLNTLYIA